MCFLTFHIYFLMTNKMKKIMKLHKINVFQPIYRTNENRPKIMFGRHHFEVQIELSLLDRLP